MMAKKRIRISILTAMGIVALGAVLLGWAAAERRKRIATLTAELHRLEERANWSEQMQRHGYLSKASPVPLDKQERRFGHRGID